MPKNKNERSHKNFYVVEFRNHRGRPAHTRSMDVVTVNWFVVHGSGNTLRMQAYFPENPTLPDVAEDLYYRLKNKLPHGSDWPLWPVKVRGKSGKCYFSLEAFFGSFHMVDVCR